MSETAEPPSLRKALQNRRRETLMEVLRPEQQTGSELVRFRCKSLSLGSFKFSNKTHVSVAKDAIFLHANLVEDGFEIILPIWLEDFMKFEYNIESQFPMIFIETTEESAANICSRLHIENSEFSYNPTGKDETKKKIIILPVLDEEKKKSLKRIFLGLGVEIQLSDAWSTLIQARPNKVQLPEQEVTGNFTIVKYLGNSITINDYKLTLDKLNLNDTIIDFCLQYFFSNRTEKTHLFSCFFWSSLLRTKDLSLAEKKDANRGWTRNVDIFEKDFIIIPINLGNVHWVLAIICFPGLEKPKLMSEYMSPKSTNDDFDQAIVQPCILIFDSLGAQDRKEIVSILRDYLRVEWRHKRGTERIFKMRDCCPEVPLQDNNYDCGLYLLEYAESFFENPIKDFHFPITGLKEWFPINKMSIKRLHITDLIMKLEIEQLIKE